MNESIATDAPAIPPKRTRLVRLNVRVTRFMRDQIEELAKAEQRTPASMVRVLLGMGVMAHVGTHTKGKR